MTANTLGAPGFRRIQPFAQRIERRRLGKVGLGDDDPVGDRGLFDGFRMAVQLAVRVYRHRPS